MIADRIGGTKREIKDNKETRSFFFSDRKIAKFIAREFTSIYDNFREINGDAKSITRM